ncbi:helix-turn-helix domain-containing protein [Komagataeibacter medellinensis]|nr:helix-turn-helix transcriptional regulator [Komagataeibacter medellinensis]
MSIRDLSHIATFLVKQIASVFATQDYAETARLRIMVDDTSLGARLKKLRRERKLPQIEVATAVDISRSHLAEIEGGKDPGFRTFCDLADFFGVPLDYLYRGTKPSAPGHTINQAKDADEIFMLEFWRGLSSDEKRLLLAFLRRDGLTGAA